MASRFLREVRSVTVLFDAQPDGALPDATRLASWLQEYDATFKTALGVPCGQSLHLLYGRTLNILGPRLLDQTPAVFTIAATARACGFSVGVQLKVREVLESATQLDALLEARPMGSVFLDFRDLPESGELDSSAVRLVEKLMSAGLSLTLLARPEVLRRIGALESEIVNASNFQIIPAEDDSTGAEAPRTGRARKIIPIGPGVDERRPPFDPCATRMQIFIGPDGYVFPCQGLAGLAEFALCNVEAPFDKACFSDEGSPLDLAGLLAFGPRIPESFSDRSLTVCERHRKRLAAMPVR